MTPGRLRRLGRATYQVGAPWIRYSYLSSDWRARMSGRAIVALGCTRCPGADMWIRLRFRRLSAVPMVPAHHPAVLLFSRKHAHPASTAVAA